ncbi:hypothetical protein GDO86_013285 [Hymenochirus boettgeri]|nr:hypothetical protein GDO86_013285 [Hymenochirus boettgeri]
MSHISQSQFIPLAEVLCCAISDMNTAHILVTQESLMDHVIKHYPGIATPSQDILYNALGALIRERKVYHTGEGYFIVTPQTYFITRKPAVDNKYAGAENIAGSPPSITYLVSMESCADLTKGNMPSVSHCRSCSCFSEQLVHNILGQQSINESTAKGHKNNKEPKPMLRNQATSTSRDHYTDEKTKPQTVFKEKEKCGRKFGISLFWRTVSKKEKSRKELATFCAQFPPEEWPVRDEDNLDNIPRDVEHEIIKRINPVLTVDNLMKHTLLMQKAEEQKKYFSKGTSTEIMKNKQGCNFKGSNRRKNGRLSRHHKKVQSGKEKGKKGTCGPRTAVQEERVSVDQTDVTEDTLAIDKHCHINAETVQYERVYKKQINNPFEGIPYRENSKTNGPKSLKEIKSRRSGKQKRSVPRSRSLDCAERKTGDLRVEHSHADKPIGLSACVNEAFKGQFHSVVSDKDDLKEYPPSYPQSSTLRIDDKFKPTKEVSSASGPYSEEGGYICDEFQKKLSIHSELDLEYEAVNFIYKVNSLQPKHCQNEANSKAIGRIPYDLPEHPEILKVCNYSASGLNERDLPKYSGFHENGPFSAENNTVYQRTIEDDACRYLYLDDNDNITKDCQVLENHAQKANLDTPIWNDLEEYKSDHSQSQWNPNIQFASQYVSTLDNEEKHYSPVFSLDSSHECRKQTLTTKGCLVEPLAQYVHLEVEPESVECINSSEQVDGSIFDYCNSSEANSLAEALQISHNENEEKHITDSREEQSGQMRTCFELSLFNAKINPTESTHHEKNENHSTTGDSGIESPRTRISIASSNSVILETLKRRTFLQNLEINGKSKHDALLPTSPLMQITSAMNV